MSKSLAKIEGGQISAPQPRPLAEIIADLSQPIASEHLKTKEVNNRKSGTTSVLTYISWYHAVQYLDRYAPGWSYEVRSITSVPGSVALTVRISIPCAEGLVYREATGIEDEETSSFGDPTSNAESMALRRAAAKFGLGLYLYDKGNGASSGGVRDPKPKTLGDLVTPKQLWMIRSMGREIGVDVEAECQKILKCGLEEISKRAASSLIDHLKRIGEEGGRSKEEPETAPADELRALNRKLGFSDAQLLKWLKEKFGSAKGKALRDALESLSEAEISQAIAIFKSQLEEK